MSFAQLSRFLAMSGDVTVKRTLTKQVEDQVRSGVCLVCQAKAARRGLCMNHYQLFLRRFKARDKRSAAEFEAACIREGKILPSGRMRELKTNDPFANVQ